MNRCSHHRILLASVLALLLCLTVWGRADSPVVRAVILYSPSRGHCHKVITEDLPALFEKYGDRLQVSGIDTADPSGGALFDAAGEKVDVPSENQGVPILVVADVGIDRITGHRPAIASVDRDIPRRRRGGLARHPRSGRSPGAGGGRAADGSTGNGHIVTQNNCSTTWARQPWHTYSSPTQPPMPARLTHDHQAFETVSSLDHDPVRNDSRSSSWSA